MTLRSWSGQAALSAELDRIPRAKLAGATVRYAHEFYGCDSGCCGHVFSIVPADHGDPVWGNFEFCHNREELDEMAGEIASYLGIGRGADDYVDD